MKINDPIGITEHSDSQRQSSFWPQLALAAAAIVVAAAGGSTGLVWVVFLGAVVLSIAVIQMSIQYLMGR